QIVGLIPDAAERASLQLTPPEFASTPARFRRSDGSSAFRPQNATVYSSEQVLAAEDRLLTWSRTRTAPTVDLDTVEEAATTPATKGGPVLSLDQADAISRISVSGRVVDTLIGPAGAGKTATMHALRRAWEHEHGPGSVTGLAPSAAAAAVLAEDLEIGTENTAKWRHEHAHGRWDFRAGQLVIVDEASLAGTLALEEIAAHIAEVGAKLLLVGDPQQLTAVDAGGMLGLLVRDRPDTPRLSELHRFHHDWEKTASLSLRLADPESIDAYIGYDRVHDGSYDDILEHAYLAWQTDRSAKKSMLPITLTIEPISALNVHAPPH